MPNGYDDDWGYDEGDLPPERGPDPMVERAKEALTTFFRSRRHETFYERQLQVLFESRGDVFLTPMEQREERAQRLTLDPGFYHWITAKALGQLVAEGRLKVEQLPLGRADELEDEESVINFYRHPGHKFWKRQAKASCELVRRFSARSFGRALGRHGEAQFDRAMSRAQFVIGAEDVREWEGRRWEGGENLDRVYVRDGVAWGAEIKNRLKYITPKQLYRKLDLCDALGLKPLFIVRMLPSTYMRRVERRGGFALIFKYQFYPFGHEAFAAEVRNTLELPIGHEVARRTIDRFVRFGHERELARRRLPGR